MHQRLHTSLKTLGTLCLVLAFACDGEERSTPPITMYACNSRVAVRNGATVLKTLEYGEAFTVQRCNDRTCFASFSGKPVTILATELAPEAPPRGPKYVTGHSPSISPSEKVAILSFNPLKAEVKIGNGSWIPISDLRDLPETKEEKRAREQAEAEAKAVLAKQEREERKEQQKLLREAGIAAEQERRQFAKQLRENYLAAGADIKVSVEGSRAQRLVLEYPLINDVWLYQFQHSDTIDALRQKGFTQLDLSDGWNYAKRLTF